MSKHWNPAENKARTKLGDRFDNLHIDTKLLCTRITVPGADVDPVAVPIYHTSVYRNSSVQHYLDILQEKGYIYQRLGNPTTETAETIINELEGGQGCIMFTSGLAAITSSLLCFLKSGDHLICQAPCYSGTTEFVKLTLQKFGVQVDWVKAGAPVSEYAKLVKPNTTMLYCETPCNPDMAVVDLIEFGKLGKSLPNVLTVVDGTFASPYVQQPIKLGVDISIHSCSKYLGGHTDIIGGCATFSQVKLWKEMKSFQATNGSSHAPFDSYLLVRGLKTLSLRMAQHCNNAMALAKFLESNPKVKKVYYPGLVSHPQHDVAKKQMSSFGGMISFEMETLEAAKTLVENVKIINLAVSLGGPESLIEHPATMTHGPMLISEADRRSSGIGDGLIRLSVGLEDIEDLKFDLAQALLCV
jgi:cystathionine beta-lyase/cystathionine gamma-synthase